MNEGFPIIDGVDWESGIVQERPAVDLYMKGFLERDFDKVMKEGRSAYVVCRKFDDDKRGETAARWVQVLREMEGKEVCHDLQLLVGDGGTEGWSVEVGLVNLGYGLDHDALAKRGLVVVDQLGEEALLSEGDTTEKTFNRKNTLIPASVHFAAVIGWLDQMMILDEQGITLDQNIDVDMIVSPVGNKTISVRMVDPAPVYLNEEINFRGDPLDDYEMTRRKAGFVVSFLHALGNMYGHDIASGRALSADEKNLFGDAYFFDNLLEDGIAAQEGNNPWNWEEVRSKLLGAFSKNGYENGSARNDKMLLEKYWIR